MPIRTAVTLATLLASAAAAPLTAAEVNIYSYREPQLVEPLLAAFTAKTGIKTKLVFARDGLNERIAAEGQSSPADVLLTTDIARLTGAKADGLTQPFVSPEIASAVAANLRDADGTWVALTMRARVIFASKERVKQDQIDYAELADPKWKGKVCTRSGQHPYNTALVAAVIAAKGEAEAEKWLRGVKDNLAHRPAGGDREQVRDVFAGKCDLALGNTYYMGQMQTDSKRAEQKEWAASVKVIFPRLEGGGAHVNISGAAIARFAPHLTEAKALIAFLVSAEAQSLYADINHEYPVIEGVSPSALVKSWGALVADKMPLEKISEFRRKASEMVDKVNFDAGPNS